MTADKNRSSRTPTSASEVPKCTDDGVCHPIPEWRVRLIVNRAYGFHSANAALGLIMLTLGPINHVPPHERTTPADP